MSKLSRRTIAKRIVEQVEAGELSTKNAAKLLAAYLVTERRTNEAHLLVSDVARELESRGRTTVSVTSAHKMSTGVERELKQLFQAETSAKHVEVIADVDADLLGGLKAHSADLEIDLSVRSKLNALKAQS